MYCLVNVRFFEWPIFSAIMEKWHTKNPLISIETGDHSWAKVWFCGRVVFRAASYGLQSQFLASVSFY